MGNESPMKPCGKEGCSMARRVDEPPMEISPTMLWRGFPRHARAVDGRRRPATSPFVCRMMESAQTCNRYQKTHGQIGEWRKAFPSVTPSVASSRRTLCSSTSMILSWHIHGCFVCSVFFPATNVGTQRSTFYAWVRI